ncbi:L-rhamnose mutarotase [Chitinophaga sp. MM2321]|uniref:L-rhamnose mutarotase n=1 Tax=Chitinophaga sp. MM2321 TaxID=3137178 RepID=UPI0032D5AA42
MIRKAFLIQAKDGMAAEYERRHNPIWPELEEIYNRHGVHNFSIFLQKETGFLFGYLEVEDEAAYNRIGEYDICKEWWQHMTEVLVCEHASSTKGKEEMLREVFHLP